MPSEKKTRENKYAQIRYNLIKLLMLPYTVNGTDFVFIVYIASFPTL